MSAKDKEQLITSLWDLKDTFTVQQEQLQTNELHSHVQSHVPVKTVPRTYQSRDRKKRNDAKENTSEKTQQIKRKLIAQTSARASLSTVKAGIINVKYIPTASMSADIMTKTLPKATVEEMRRLLGLVLWVIRRVWGVLDQVRVLKSML